MKSVKEFLEEGTLKQLTTGPSRSRTGLDRQRKDASERAAFRKAGMRRTQSGGSRQRFNSTNNKNEYSKTAITSYPSQSAYAKDSVPEKEKHGSDGGGVRSTKDRALHLKRLKKQLKTTRTRRGVHAVDILPKGDYKKNDPKDSIPRGREFQRVVREVPQEVKNAGGKKGDKIVGKASEVMPGSKNPEKGRKKRRKLYSKAIGATDWDPVTKVQVASVKEQKTFSEFLELAEKYYAPDDKLPSGKSPLRKALKKQEKRESEIGPNSNITRMRKHSEKIETKVKHGSDNPNYNSRVNSRDDDEVRVDSDGTDYMTVHHKPSKVTYNVVKSPGPGNVHSIEWSHERGHREGLLPSERNSISRDARRVYDRHVSHRLPHGATLHNKPAKEGLGKIYKRAGFGNVDSDNDQFARIGREKSPKQKEKGKKGRLTPLDPKKTKRDANWDGDSRGSGGEGNDSYRLDRIANLAFGG